MSIAHVTLTVTDPAPAIAYYDAVLAPLGLLRHADYPDEEEDDATVEAAGWGGPDEAALLWVVTGTDATRSAHLALTATDPAAVVAFHAAALAAGGRSVRAPRRWAIYHRGYFGAVVADPRGNQLEAVARE